VAYRILKLVTLSHFWMPQEGTYSFKARLKDAGIDLLRIVATPVALVGLELAAIYGTFNPYDGRKLYARLCTETLSWPHAFNPLRSLTPSGEILISGMLFNHT
jgi:hypothetical protein